MRALAALIISADGWRRWLIAFAAGASGALAMAPFDFLFALAIPMTVAVWLIDGSAEAKPKFSPQQFGLRSKPFPARALRRSFIAGWWWGFGYLAAGLWWLGAAFLVEADEFAWALPLGVLGLPAVLAVFPALGFMFARLLWPKGPSRIFALAAGLTLAEWLRGHLLTGFPWNTIGMALGDNLVTAQLASVIGLYGLTTLAIVLFAAPAVLADPQPHKSGGRWLAWTARPIGVVFLAALALAAIYAFGATRLAYASEANVAGVRLRIMQPNMPQDERFRPEYKDAILAHYLLLSKGESEAGPGDATALIWPESAFPFILSRDPQALAEIGAFLPKDAILVTGAARQELRSGTIPAGFGETRERRIGSLYFNAVQVIASGGRILDSYDKVHLVPFGEYLPMQSFLERLGLQHFVHVPGGFEAGAARKTLSVPGLPTVAPLICYEAIFSGEVLPKETGAGRPGLMLNVTNDGWFGATAGPYQHFAQARLRAIEEGLPLIRAANTGISAIVDPYGRIRRQLPLGSEGVIDGDLPESIPPPIFAEFPFVSAFGVWLIALIIPLRQSLKI